MQAEILRTGPPKRDDGARSNSPVRISRTESPRSRSPRRTGESQGIMNALMRFGALQLTCQPPQILSRACMHGAVAVKASVLMQKHKMFASTKSLLSVTSSLEGSRTNVKSGLLFVEYLQGDEPVCCFCEIGMHASTKCIAVESDLQIFSASCLPGAPEGLWACACLRSHRSDA
jgi:hypothetical protein